MLVNYQVAITGNTPLIMHSAAGVDGENPLNKEKSDLTRNRGSNRTDADNIRIREIECELSLWLDGEGRPTVPAEAIRSCIETGARKLKQGPQVREGLIVLSSQFAFDEVKYGNTMKKWATNTQFTVPVVVQRQRIMRTRAMFDLPWSAIAEVEVDDELVDQDRLETWLDIAGRRIGLGDWRPEKSGKYGRFTAEVSEA